MYLSLKVLHIVAVVSWFAGLFYIFRLFVYHRMHSENREMSQVFQVMERKLLKIIIIPASVVVVLSGFAIVAIFPEWLMQSWLWFKLGFVALALVYQGVSLHTFRRFARSDFFLTEKQCRLLNEVPTLALIGAVIFVIFKPSF